MENFHELIEEAREAVLITEDVRREYNSAATHRDKALLKALNSVSSTKEALQVYKLSGNHVLKWLALNQAMCTLGTELCNLEDYNALPSGVSLKANWGVGGWLYAELRRTGVIPNECKYASDFLYQLSDSFWQEKGRKLELIGQKITTFELLLEYWNLLPKEIRYDVRDNMIQAISSAEELRSFRDKYKKSRIWLKYDSVYKICLYRLENGS